MKIKLKLWDEVVKLGKEKNCCEFGLFNKVCVFGLYEDALPWGEYVDTEPYGKPGYYNVDSYGVPFWMAEKDDSTFADDVLQYGNIIKLDDFFTDTHLYIRISLVAYGGSLYYHKRVNGEVIEFRRVGRADE